MPPDLETQLRPIGIADVEALTVVQVNGWDLPVVDVHPVEAAVVDGYPPALIEPQHEVCAGDQWVGDADIGAKVATDNDIVSSGEGAG
jgi:hypothetical protein